MKILLITAIVVGSIILAGAAGAGYFFFSNLSSPEPPPSAPATEPSPPEESEPTPEQPAPTPSVEEKVKSVEEAIAEVAASGESKEVTLIFTEAEINERASALLTQVDIPGDIPLEIKSVQIDLQSGNNLLARAETVASDFDVTIEVKAQVGVIEGKPDVNISNVSLGNPLLDALLKDRITTLLTERIDGLLVQLTEYEVGGAGIDLEFKEINIQEEEMTITAIVKPKA